MTARLIDSGVAEGRRQLAYSAALAELHEAGRVTDTVRFLRFPPSVLIGRHQILAHEVDLARARAEGIGLVRRISGGGAIYLDEGQVGWELVCRRSRIPSASLDDCARAVASAVAAGLSAAFGIDARFRPRNDIEVDGRKISGTGGFFLGDTIVYHGTVIVDMDLRRVRDLLNVPSAKLARHGVADGGARLVTLTELIGRRPAIDEVHGAVLHGLAAGLGIETASATPGPEELARTEALLTEEIGTDDFVFGAEPPHAAHVLTAERATPGGSVRVDLRLEGHGPARRIREALVTGDFFIAPPRFIRDLEARLRGTLTSEADAAVSALLDAMRPAALSLPPDALRLTLRDALERDDDRETP